jgi:hypothetical protein
MQTSNGDSYQNLQPFMYPRPSLHTNDNSRYPQPSLPTGDDSQYPELFYVSITTIFYYDGCQYHQSFMFQAPPTNIVESPNTGS